KVEGSLDSFDEHPHWDVTGVTGVLVVLLPYGSDVRAGVHHDRFDTELARFLDAPNVHALAAHSILVLLRRFEHGDADALARQRVSQRRAPNSAADDRDIGHVPPPVRPPLRTNDGRRM